MRIKTDSKNLNKTTHLPDTYTLSFNELNRRSSGLIPVLEKTGHTPIIQHQLSSNDGLNTFFNFEKAAIFIDGGYLKQILLKQFKKPEINHERFCKIICQELQINRLRTYYYHAMPFKREKNKHDEKLYVEMQRFMEGIKRLPRFEVKLGKVQLINGKFKQKMVDVLMSLDIATMCIEKQIQQAVIVAGDSDFIPAIKKAKDAGAVIHLVYHPSSVHNALLDEIDEAHIITKELIEKCAR